MDIDKIKGIIEAVLFSSGRVITLDELSEALELEKKEIAIVLEEMKLDYQNDTRGIEIINVNNGYTLSSKRKYHEYIYAVIDKRAKASLSQAALEVLAIIAYNPRITRAEIEDIRGVNSDASLYRLLEHDMIQEAGKLDLPGKPMSYQVTEKFLKKFGLSTLKDLPELPKYKLDDNQQIVVDDFLLTTEGDKKEKQEEKEDDTESKRNNAD